MYIYIKKRETQKTKKKSEKGKKEKRRRKGGEEGEKKKRRRKEGEKKEKRRKEGEKANKLATHSKSNQSRLISGKKILSLRLDFPLVFLLNLSKKRCAIVECKDCKRGRESEGESI